jgi:diguanylate cyclase (GGDEF)-like protein
VTIDGARPPGAPVRLPIRAALARPPLPVAALRVLLIGLLATLAVSYIPLIGAGFPRQLQNYVAFAVSIDVAILIVLRAALRRVQRPMWVLFAFGLTCNVVGTAYSILVLTNGGVLTSVSLADVWWFWYPAIYLGIVVTIWAHAGHTRYRTLLDGATAGLGAAAIFSQLVIEILVGPHRASGVATTLGYPIGDSLLVAAVLCVLAATHRRDRRALGLIATGVLIYAAADTGWLTLAVRDDYRPGNVVDLVFSVSFALIGWSAWLDEPVHRAASTPEEGTRLTLPIVFALAALGQLLVATQRPTPLVSICLDALTLLAVMVRGVVSFHHVNSLGEARHREARLDELTGLANRRAYHEHLAAQLAQRPRPPLSVLLMDLDHFKEVNDSFGHHVGDQLLRDTAERLRDLVRPDDFLARLGGDEFVIVLSGRVINDAHLRALADRVCTRLRQSIEIGGRRVRVDVSIGISSSADAHQKAETLLQHADIAMYEAKRSRRGHAFYAVDAASRNDSGRRSVRNPLLADHPVDAGVGDDPHDRHGDEACQGDPHPDMAAPVDRQRTEYPGDVKARGNPALDVGADRLPQRRLGTLLPDDHCLEYVVGDRGAEQVEPEGDDWSPREP